MNIICLQSIPHLWFCASKTATLGPELQISVSQTVSVVLSIQNCDFTTRITSLYVSQPSSVVLCIQNREFSTRITSLYRLQNLPLVLSMQNSVISTRITSLYVSQPSSAVLSRLVILVLSTLFCIHNCTGEVWVP